MFLFLLCSHPKVNSMNCEPWEQAGKVVTLLREFHLFLNKGRYIFSWMWLRHNVSYHTLFTGPAPPSIILLTASAPKEKTCYYIFWGVAIFPEFDDYEASVFLKIYILCHILPNKISLNINRDFMPNWVSYYIIFVRQFWFVSLTFDQNYSWNYGFVFVVLLYQIIRKM